MIDGYNSTDPVELRYLPRIIGNRIRMQGFIVTDFMGRANEFYRDMSAMLSAGQLQQQETVHDGLNAMPVAFLGLFSGDNRGKMLVRL